MHLHRKTLTKYFALQSLHKVPSQYYFVLQSLHKVRPSTTLRYKACTKAFPVLLCTAKLAQIHPSSFPHKTSPVQHLCSHQTAICNQRVSKRIRVTHTWTTTRCRTQRRNRLRVETIQAAPAAHPRYLSSPAAATLHERDKVSCSGFSPQNKPHATFMQPLNCDLQPEGQQTNRVTHTWTTTRCRAQRRNRLRVETIQAAPAAHPRYLSSPAAATLHKKRQGFLLRLFPQQKPHATFMQPFYCDPQPESQQTN